MKTICLSFAAVTAALSLAACDAQINTTPPVVEKKDTTIINPPAAAPVEKKVEKVETNTTIVNPPAEKKE